MNDDFTILGCWHEKFFYYYYYHWSYMPSQPSFRMTIPIYAPKNAPAANGWNPACGYGTSFGWEHLGAPGSLPSSGSRDLFHIWWFMIFLSVSQWTDETLVHRYITSVHYFRRSNPVEIITETRYFLYNLVTMVDEVSDWENLGT